MHTSQNNQFHGSDHVMYSLLSHNYSVKVTLESDDQDQVEKVTSSRIFQPCDEQSQLLLPIGICKIDAHGPIR